MHPRLSSGRSGVFGTVFRSVLVGLESGLSVARKALGMLRVIATQAWD